VGYNYVVRGSITSDSGTGYKIKKKEAISKMVSLTIPIAITVLGVLYIVSPVDLLPDFIPGVGWLDDLLVLMFIGFTWMVTLGVAALEALMPVIKVMAIVIGAIYGLKLLLKNKRKIKRMLR